MTDSEAQEAATIIDRLLGHIPTDDYNSVDSALLWLLKNDHVGLSLTVRTRDRMTKFRVENQ